MSVGGEQAIEETLRRAMTLHQGGRLAEAVRLYHEILQSQPKHLGATYFLGVSYAQQNQLDLAAQYFSRATNLNPGFADAHFSHGLACHSLGNFQAAVLSYNRVTQLTPDRFDAHFNRGSALGRRLIMA